MWEHNLTNGCVLSVKLMQSINEWVNTGILGYDEPVHLILAKYKPHDLFVIADVTCTCNLPSVRHNIEKYLRSKIISYYRCFGKCSHFSVLICGIHRYTFPKLWSKLVQFVEHFTPRYRIYVEHWICRFYLRRTCMML